MSDQLHEKSSVKKKRGASPLCFFAFCWTRLSYDNAMLFTYITLPKPTTLRRMALSIQSITQLFRHRGKTEEKKIIISDMKQKKSEGRW